MSFEENFHRYTEKMWAEREQLLNESAGSELLEDLIDFRNLPRRDAQYTEYLCYVLATLPISDLAEYEFPVISHAVRHAMHCRKKYEWCRALSERDFLLWVLYPRINNEELSDCREQFYYELEERVEGLSLMEAALEVNRWCAEHVTYRSTDDRTASAMAVFTCGFGRCGEESMFAVNALRSVGIAARQVYAPWWSHCDDNHAWVEIFDGERWRYLGACEPEPVLDRGWFTAASARAMMVYARVFVSGEREDYGFLFPQAGDDLTVEHGVGYLAVTDHYAKTGRVTVTVTDTQGQPVRGARVSAGVLNMLAFREIWTAQTDESGRVSIPLGYGSVRLTAVQGDDYAESQINTAETAQVTLVLHPVSETAPLQEVVFLPPTAEPTMPAALTEEQQNVRREWLAQAVESRASQPRYIQGKVSETQQCVLNMLSEKDCFLPVPTDVLDDGTDAFAYAGTLPNEQFVREILPQRISTEPLRTWRRVLSGRDFEGGFDDVQQWVAGFFRPIDQMQELAASPLATLHIGGGTEHNRTLLVKAVCRANGIVYQDPTPTGTLRITGVSNVSETVSASVWQSGLGFVPCAPLAEVNTLPAGVVQVITAKRLPNGKQLATVQQIILRAGETTELACFCREPAPEEMLEHRPLPPFVLESLAGVRTESRDLWAESAALLVWLEVSREPTEHILNELAEAAPQGCALHLILQHEDDQNDPTLQRALRTLPDAILWLGNFAEDAAALARQMFGDPDHLPLVLLVGQDGCGLYSCSGYNVGTAKLVQKLVDVYHKE